MVEVLEEAAAVEEEEEEEEDEAAEEVAAVAAAAAVAVAADVEKGEGDEKRHVEGQFDLGSYFAMTAVGEHELLRNVPTVPTTPSSRRGIRGAEERSASIANPSEARGAPSVRSTNSLAPTTPLSWRACQRMDEARTADVGQETGRVSEDRRAGW